MFATREGTADQVKALLDGGASLTNQPGYDQDFDKHNWLITASLYAKESADKLLHLKEAGLDLAHKNANGQNGLGHIGQAHDRRSADFEGQDVVSADLSSAINVLLDGGADIDGCTTHLGQTVLHHFARVGVEPYVLERVIELGADVNARDVSGTTPLFYANKAEIVHCLIEHGADPTHKDLHGNTPARSPYAWAAAEILELAAKRHSLTQIAATQRPQEDLATPEQALAARQARYGRGM
ncbi:ankyrin repeat domain-containing protein [Luteimonas sp. MC1750]|uniref:ankyrin repeat domain-containing protein n=1 Tax=Luteimonas sp. MC1750 TaxID=2799326 RepID=UPI0018F08ACA|nr:ankyrin repeat domain-containing protein [Luteimonas sp. MC1750]MBJ6983983.1 ankyrin repeat domain-containing protein [Luteimonas sp. MC1750]QQO06795.1 ankyrin repeat domain-containing protein [Luteimonas sp. MC1750]